MPSFRHALAVAASVVALSATSPMQARDVVSSNATSFCNGALPSFEGALRKRPLGIANEGTAPAFVTCSLPTGYGAVATANVLASFVNRGPGPASVTCTLVDGVVAELGLVGTGLPAPRYFPKTIAIGAGEPGLAIWLPEPPGEGVVPAFSVYNNLNCNLPAGVEINLVGAEYLEDGDAR